MIFYYDYFIKTISTTPANHNIMLAINVIALTLTPTITITLADDGRNHSWFVHFFS